MSHAQIVCYKLLSLNQLFCVFFLRCFMCVVCFFFSSRRRHTRCSRDWSSDVCSSDLVANANSGGACRRCLRNQRPEPLRQLQIGPHATVLISRQRRKIHRIADNSFRKIGRASCRERVEISVVGGGGKKKKENELTQKQ